jgi:hypothetical protein
MSHRGKEFTPAMKRMVVKLKQHFDAERDAGSVVLTKDSSGRTAKALDIGKATVKRIMAEYNKNGQKIMALWYFPGLVFRFNFKKLSCFLHLLLNVFLTLL